MFLDLEAAERRAAQTAVRGRVSEGLRPDAGSDQACLLI